MIIRLAVIRRTVSLLKLIQIQVYSDANIQSQSGCRPSLVVVFWHDGGILSSVARLVVVHVRKLIGQRGATSRTRRRIDNRSIRRP